MGIGKGLKKLVGASKNAPKVAHCDRSEHPTLPSTRPSTSYQPSVNNSYTCQENFVTDDNADYSRTSSAEKQTLMFHEEPVVQTLRPRISWLGGIPNNPYGYTVHFEAPTARPESLAITRKPLPVAAEDKIKPEAVERKPLLVVLEDKAQHSQEHSTRVQHQPPPPSGGPEREKIYPNSLRRNRHYSSRCKPLPEPGPEQYGGPMNTTAYAAARHRVTNVLDLVEEDEVVEQTKREIRSIKMLDAESMRNTLRLAHQCFDVGSGTLETLRYQGEHLAHAERNLISATHETDVASRRIQQLREADRMVPPTNPFTISKRKRKDQAEILASHRRQRESRDIARSEAWSKWMLTNVDKFVDIPLRDGDTRYRPFEFEPDAEDEELEDGIVQDLEEMGRLAPCLRGLALDQGAELEQQNKRLRRMEYRANYVDDGLAINKAKLDRFH